VKFSEGYVCGAICSSGKIVWDEKHSNYYISLETGQEEYANLFAEALERIVGKEVKRGERMRSIPTRTVTVYGKKDVSALARRWELSPGRRNWSVPRDAFTDSDFRGGFVRGFFDGNGSVSVSIEDYGKRTKKRSIRAYSVNRKGLTGVKRLLEMEGVKSIMYPCGDSFTIKISGKMRLEMFMHRIGFGLNDKMRDLDRALLPQSLSRYEDQL